MKCPHCESEIQIEAAAVLPAQQGDARPQYKVTINFMTAEDVVKFAEKTGLPVTTQSDSAWFPRQEPLRGQFYYDGPKTDSKYPVCIPSKGRAECQQTGKRVMTEPFEGGAVLNTVRFPIAAVQ